MHLSSMTMRVSSSFFIGQPNDQFLYTTSLTSIDHDCHINRKHEQNEESKKSRKTVP